MKILPRRVKGSPYLLPGEHSLPREVFSQIAGDYERFSTGLPRNLPGYLLERYGLDVSGEYAGRSVRLPFGKGAGQLSLSAKQVEGDARGGLGFVVLKSVVSETREGTSLMEEWRESAPGMVVERIRGHSGEEGWTVTWRGKGWDRSFAEYLNLLRRGLEIARASGMPVVPSCIFSLPGSLNEPWAEEEFEFTLESFFQLWQGEGLPLEIDFSPTLAGHPLSRDPDLVLRWVRGIVPALRRAAKGRKLTVGIKLMNTLFDDAFQLEMVREAAESGADFLVCFNRLFDPDREFDGKRGVAYGGPDLSERNLRILDMARSLELKGDIILPGVSATGNICTGKMMLEYALRGSSSGQIHTFFMLPSFCYGMRGASRTERALHELIFNPKRGLAAWMLALRETGIGIDRDGKVRFTEVARWYKAGGAELFS